MNKYLKYISSLVFLICLFLILNFKAIPNGKLWTNYSLLYVSAETDDSLVIDTLESLDIKNYVALSNQFLPVNLSSNSLELALYKMTFQNDETDYLQRRNKYFFDKSEQYRLYYIPLEYKDRISAVVTSLNNKKIPCGVDSTSSYPWILPLAGLLLLISLSLFTKKKYVFIGLGISPVIFLYCNPFYPVGISLVFILLINLFIANTWKREGYLSRLGNTYLVPMLGLVSLLCAFSTNYITGLLYLLVLISIASMLITMSSLEDFVRNRKSFVPVYIKPAKMINVFARKTNTVMIVVITASLVFTGLLFITSNESVNSHFAKLLLPANTDFEDDNLPQLEEYYRWTWDIKTAPYRSLNKTENENYVEYPKYTEDEKGLIKETKFIMAYNQNFKENTFNDIDALPFNSIESVIKSEGIKFSGGYKSTSDYHNSFFGIIMMFISIFILLFIYISIIIRKGTKK